MTTRKEKGLQQKLFLIETFPTDDELKKKFVVMGSTGNVYEVTIQNKTECTCPDYIFKKSACKHIYFVLLKVMKSDMRNVNKFNNEQLIELFQNIPEITKNLIVNTNIRNLYFEVILEEEKNEDGTVNRKPIHDVCPICLENLDDGNKLDWCKFGCGNSIHRNCFRMWSIKNQNTCVFCRKEWEKKKENKKINSGSYINLIESSNLPNNNTYIDQEEEEVILDNFNHDENEDQKYDSNLQNSISENNIRELSKINIKIKKINHKRNNSIIKKNLIRNKSKSLVRNKSKINKNTNNYNNNINKQTSSVNITPITNSTTRRGIRARNPYMIYADEQRQIMADEGLIQGSKITTEISKRWNMLDEGKKIYKDLALKEKEEIKILERHNNHISSKEHNRKRRKPLKFTKSKSVDKKAKKKKSTIKK